MPNYPSLSGMIQVGELVGNFNGEINYDFSVNFSALDLAVANLYTLTFNIGTKADDIHTDTADIVQRINDGFNNCYGRFNDITNWLDVFRNDFYIETAQIRTKIDDCENRLVRLESVLSEHTSKLNSIIQSLTALSDYIDSKTEALTLQNQQVYSQTAKAVVNWACSMIPEGTEFSNGYRGVGLKVDELSEQALIPQQVYNSETAITTPYWDTVNQAAIFPFAVKRYGPFHSVYNEEDLLYMSEELPKVLCFPWRVNNVAGG